MKEMKKLLCSLLFLITGWQVAQAQDLSRFKVLSDSTYQTTEKQSDNKYKKKTNIKMNKEMKFCQSCGMLSARMPMAVRMKITACTATGMENSCRTARWKR